MDKSACCDRTYKKVSDTYGCLFPSAAERRIPFVREGVLFGGSVGFDYNCLFDYLLLFLPHNKMLTHLLVDINTSTWRREACEAVRAHSCEHADERLWTRQRAMKTIA